MATTETEFRRVLLFVSYDGTNYSGFARQDNATTVAGLLEHAIAEIDPRASSIACSSRTDAGVHAQRHPVSFATSKPLAERSWVLALSTRLPRDIAVTRACYVPNDFDPRRDPLYKRYLYRVLVSPVGDPFLDRFSWKISQKLDIPLMRAEAAALIGSHDFAAFRNMQDSRRETVRHLDFVQIEPDPTHSECIQIRVQGNRFLYNMVRIIAGTLVDVGRGRLAPNACSRALQSKDRRDLGMTAPAHGLLLQHVELRTPLDPGWPREG
jgi:tRNA pseudouridine38-40 synthase